MNRDQTQQNLFCKATWNFAKSGLKGSFTLSESDIAYRWALGKSDLLFTSKIKEKFAFASVFGQCKWTLKEAAVCKKAHYAINMPHVFTDSPKAKCQTSSCYGPLTLRVSFNTTVRDDAPVCTQSKSLQNCNATQADLERQRWRSVDADAYALFTLDVCVCVNVTVKV